MSTGVNTQQKQLVCRAPDCHFEVRDTEVDELIRITLDHAQRIHHMTVPVETLRAAIEPVERGTRESAQKGK